MNADMDRLRSILLAINLRLGVPDEECIRLADGTVRLLSENFAGDRLYIGRMVDTLDRDTAILADRRAGASVRQLSKAHGVSIGTVFAVLKAARVQCAGELLNAGRADHPRDSTGAR